MAGLGAFDIAVAVLMLALVVYGMLKGMTRLVLWFAGLAVGWVLAMRYCEPIALKIGAGGALPSAGPDLRRLAAFALIFFGVVAMASMLAWLITQVLGAARLRWLDRLAGGGLGLLLAILLACAATVPLAGLWPPDGGDLMNGSVLAPYAVAGGDYLKFAAPEPLRGRFAAASRALFARLAGGEAVQPTGPKPEPAPRPR